VAVHLLTLTVVLDYADRATFGAVTPAVRGDLHLNLVDLGYLGAAFGLVGGAATVVAGLLVDRAPRMRLLAVSALLWAIAMIATGAAQTLLWLLLARGALAVVLATVGPAYPSLVGDAVPAARRGRALATIDSGQLVGGAVGVGVGAAALLLLSWRWAFWALALPSLVLAWRYWVAAEPERRGRPADEGVSIWHVARRLWHTPTAVQVLLSGAVSSYYLSGAAAFSVVFAVARYSVSTPVADLALLALGVGGLAGIWAGGRLSDLLSNTGRGAARLTWSGCAFAASAFLWLPPLLLHSLGPALPFLVLGAMALAATIPALDAVRVDVIPSRLRGRTESVRTVVRVAAEGTAPLVFGYVAASYGGDDTGLQRAFLLTLPGLVIAGGLLLFAARTHDADRAREATSAR
jgi:predicted MFS family arabinose efflux permease